MNRCVARNYGGNYENEGNLPPLKIPSAEEREQCRQETEVLAILTGLEIDSAKSGIKPDLSEYLGGSRGRKSLFLRYKTIHQKSDSRKWYQPTKKERMDSFFFANFN